MDPQTEKCLPCLRGANRPLHCSPPGIDQPLNKRQAVWSAPESQGSYLRQANQWPHLLSALITVGGKKNLFTEQHLPLYSI